MSTRGIAASVTKGKDRQPSVELPIGLLCSTIDLMELLGIGARAISIGLFFSIDNDDGIELQHGGVVIVLFVSGYFFFYSCWIFL